MKFLEALKEKILVCDGAMGSLLIKDGADLSRGPEFLNLSNPDMIRKVQKQYADAGADILLANTFGASDMKLQEYDLVDQQEEIVKAAIEIARSASKKDGFVCGELGPLGALIEPLGDFSFDDAVNSFTSLCKLYQKYGADAIIIETMADIKEVKAAIIAAKQNTDLPVWVQMTFDESGRTLYGTSPEALASVCDGLGVDVVGVNCGVGPAEMFDVIKVLCDQSNMFVAVQPNAGLPLVENGETVYKLSPEAMQEYVYKFAEIGVNIIGGCCGTTPAHIAKIADAGLKLTKRNIPYKPSFASRTKVVDFAENAFPLVIGERINPTARKALTAEIIAGKTNVIRDNAKEQVENGADLLDVNVGVSTGDEAAFMKMAVDAVEAVTDVPVVIDSTDALAVEAGLKMCSGRPLINSVNGKDSSMDAVIPLAVKYGALLLVLPVDDKGIPKTADERFAVAMKIVNKALASGMRKEDLVVDGLTLTVSTNQDDVAETLNVLKMLKDEGIKTVLGVSNISYGMPARNQITASFLSLAIWNGLSMAIINPNIKVIMDSLYSAAVLCSRDKQGQKYIARQQAKDLNETTFVKKDTASKTPKTIDEKMYSAVLTGDKDNIVELIEEAIAGGKQVMDISMDVLIPALEEVGVKFDKKEYFLPQLILAAETMQAAFGRIKQEFKDGDTKNNLKVVMATVEGDVHDIGKNIVTTVLESHGFDVCDMGKNVTADEIVAEAEKRGAAVIGLSALMTTTMQNMRATIDLVKNKGLDVKTVLGGAVVTDDFAKEIGADGYALDALSAVETIKNITKKA